MYFMGGLLRFELRFSLCWPCLLRQLILPSHLNLSGSILMSNFNNPESYAESGPGISPRPEPVVPDWVYLLLAKEKLQYRFSYFVVLYIKVDLVSPRLGLLDRAQQLFYSV